MTGIELIAAERKRQVTVEGWSEFHDDSHTRGQMARAAACYALQHTNVSGRAIRWPWASQWWKPRDPIRNLVRAGALIAAEIDRLQRANRGRPQK
jgi:hypothetical protein